MRIEAENAIVQRLMPLVEQGLFLENAPQASHPQPKARLLVFYDNSTANPPTMLGPVLQERSVRFRLNLELIDLRTHQTAYPYLDRIEELLTGFEPLGTGKGEIFLVSDDLAQTEKGEVAYTMQVAFRAAHLQTEK